MSTPAVAVESQVVVAKSRSFLWRRLHSLSGVVPVGGYLAYHIYENMTAIRGPGPYDEMVNKVNTMLPRIYFYGVELGLVILPLLFHALYGLYIAMSGQPNTSRYAYGSNWSYVMQRVSGYVAFVYILIHVGVLRVFVTLFGNHLAPYAGPGEGKLDLVTYADVAAHLGNSHHAITKGLVAGDHMFVIYIVGTLLTIWHFTNGLNGFCWTWGIAVGRVAQKRVQQVAWVLFAALAAATLNILFVMRFSSPA